MAEQITALSVIDSIDTKLVNCTMEKIHSFQSIIQQAVKPGHDIGIIPGTSKPTLLKPGAEKIVMMMGLSSRYEIMDKVEDYDKGFFAYNIRCTLSRPGLDICEGVGHCNSRENKYSQADPFSITNTILKMVKKRSFVDAVLSVASLSDVFTQDLEDMPELRIESSGASHWDNQGKVWLEQQITFGKHRGRTLGDLLQNERQYLVWLSTSDNARWSPLARQVLAEDGGQPAENSSENGLTIKGALGEERPEAPDLPPTVVKMVEVVGMSANDFNNYCLAEHGQKFAALTAAEKSAVTRHLHELGRVGV